MADIPKPVMPNLGHLTIADGSHAPTPEQVAKENARRRGRRNKNWWKEDTQGHTGSSIEGGEKLPPQEN